MIVTQIVLLYWTFELSLRCKPGFNGPRCENKDSSSGGNNCIENILEFNDFLSFMCIHLVGAILGGVFGGVAVLGLVVAGSIYIVLKKRAIRFVE